MPTDDLASDPRYWQLAPGAAWHGYRHVTPGYAMTDPNKLTLLTPGFDRQTGAYSEHGLPAPVLAQYLRENRIVAEKNDLNSILFLLTPGVESSKAGTLLSALVFFKRLHDDNAPLEDVIPEFVRQRAAALRRDAAARPVPANARLLSRPRHQRAAAPAVPPRAFPDARDAAAGSGSPAGEATKSIICRSTNCPGASRPRCGWSIRPASPRSSPASAWMSGRSR